MSSGIPRIYQSFAEFEREELRRLDSLHTSVDDLVEERFAEGQLREAPITLREIGVVKREFARVLGGMYHARVEYPKAVPTSVPATV